MATLGQFVCAITILMTIASTLIAARLLESEHESKMAGGYLLGVIAGTIASGAMAALALSLGYLP